MSNTEVAFTKNFFFEAYIVKDHDFGNIALGYFEAFKALDELEPEKRDEAQSLLSTLFKNSNVVAGDLNSTPKKIKEVLSTLGMYASILAIPSYMFPLPEVTEPVFMPSFDNFVIFDKTINGKIESPIKLPETLTIDPRKYMSEIKSPSDHVPVVGVLTKNKKRLVIGIYNVADPVFWGKQYPKAAHGFDITDEGEKARLSKLEKVLNSFIEICDLVFLTEVPAGFVEHAIAIGHKLGRQVYVKDMQDTKPETEKAVGLDLTQISKSMLFTK